MDPDLAPKKSKNPLIIISLIVLLLLLGAVAWYFLMDEDEEESSVTATKVSTESAQIATDSAQGNTDQTEITKALAVKHNTTEDKLTVVISSNDGTYAKGTLNTKGEETGGGYFLAYKESGAWTIVYSGQATPDCAVINSKAFPIALVPECLDSNGNLVQRS